MLQEFKPLEIFSIAKLVTGNSNYIYVKINLKINSSKLWLNKFPWKKRNDHKYSRGKLIIFGSQPNMIGSTILSSEAALRVGTGSVKIICSKRTLPIYSLKFPSVLKEEINSLSLLKKLIINQTIFKQKLYVSFSILLPKVELMGNQKYIWGQVFYKLFELPPHL